MILGTHNSWSFRTPTKWWMKLLSFTARCQNLNIKKQYGCGARCFDLRIRIIKGIPHIVHNAFDYGTIQSIEEDLLWLNEKDNIKVRIVHDVRTQKLYTKESITLFQQTARMLENKYQNIQFWLGYNLYNWKPDYEFSYKPECIEKYSSVCPPRIIDDWWPYIYAALHNPETRRRYSVNQDPSQILLIDYVQIN